MAVKAQYPSNLAAGDSRPAAFEGETNPKWHCWAQMDAPTVPPPAMPAIQLVSLAELHSNRHRQQKEPLRLLHEQRSSLSDSASTSSIISEGIHEIDWFLKSQLDELRRAVAEHRRRQYPALLAAAAARLRKKEAEAETAARRGAELERRVAELADSADGWRARARAQEAAAAALQVQLRRTAVCREAPPAAAEDAVSSTADASLAPSPACKSCRRRSACVVALPCRHLCMCAECDSVARVCPSCHSVMGGSVHVYLS